ncbi:hypothetical protein NC651_033540 [Populus alba x Populus x berolinensis]|nr:hypothetical protein NC651_033540 [Populus alba x Populus x berolinensis]
MQRNGSFWLLVSITLWPSSCVCRVCPYKVWPSSPDT